MLAEENPVTQALNAYAAAVFDKDVAAFAAIYADDVHVFDSWGRWEYTGLADWTAMASEWFASLGEERVEVTFDAIEVAAGERIAFGHGAAVFTALAADGARLRSMRNRLTLALELRSDGWKIVHEHTSLPIDFETGAALSPR